MVRLPVCNTTTGHRRASALSKLIKSPDATAEDWSAFLEATEEAAKASVADWHIRQTRGLYADYLRDHNDSQTAAQVDARIAADAEERICEWHGAAANALAHAALDSFDRGDRTSAVEYARQAMFHFGQSAVSPDHVFEKLLAALRAH